MSLGYFITAFYLSLHDKERGTPDSEGLQVTPDQISPLPLSQLARPSLHLLFAFLHSPTPQVDACVTCWCFSNFGMHG